MNIIALTGRLGKDPELRQTPAGKSVCTINLAVADDFDRDKTDWIPVVFWEKQAETVTAYLSKGSKIGVTGKLKTREYTDKDGNKRTAFEVRANSFEFLDSKKDGGKYDGKDDFIRLEDSDEDLPF